MTHLAWCPCGGRQLAKQNKTRQMQKWARDKNPLFVQGKSPSWPLVPMLISLLKPSTEEQFKQNHPCSNWFIVDKFYDAKIVLNLIVNSRRILSMTKIAVYPQCEFHTQKLLGGFIDKITLLNIHLSKLPCCSCDNASFRKMGIEL